MKLVAATPFPVARLIQAVMDSVPANADVHVEINQNAPVGFESQIEIQQQQQQQQAASSTGASTTSTNSETGYYIIIRMKIYVISKFSNIQILNL